MDYARTFLLLLMGALGAQGQSLRAPVSTATAGGSGVFSIFLESPTGRDPVALQWDLTVPQAMSVNVRNIEIGEDAKSAAKTLTCAERKKSTPSTRKVYTCILAGGTRPIPAGPIALVHYTVIKDSGGPPIRVAITGVLGAAGNAARIDMPDTEAIIRLR